MLGTAIYGISLESVFQGLSDSGTHYRPLRYRHPRPESSERARYCFPWASKCPVSTRHSPLCARRFQNRPVQHPEEDGRHYINS